MKRHRRTGAGIAVAVMIISVLALVVVAPRVGNVFAGVLGVHDAAALPGKIQLCGRSWRKDALDRRFTEAELELFGGGAVVDPGPLGSCPSGPCTDVAQPRPCGVVVWVRVGEDAYLHYSLQGGP